MPALKVALVNLTSGGLSGGYAKYLAALLPLIDADSRVAHLAVFAPPGVTVPGFEQVRTWAAGTLQDPHRDLRRQLAAIAPDVIFFPTARLVRLGSTPTVVMVRNMEPLTVPFAGNPWKEGLRNVARAIAARAACRRASRVIAVSKHVETFVKERWRVPEDRISVVYHGIAPVRERPASLIPSKLRQLRSGFLFTAGSIRAARGLEDAIRALPDVVRRNPGQTLVIAGHADASGRSYATRMAKLARSLGIERAVTWAGQLTSAEMAWAYSRCGAFIVTSRAEACPNVALEAMSYGARIVSTSQEPMPEFFGEAAAYYRPGDFGQLAVQLNAILSGPADAAKRAIAGAARAATFTWERTADNTIRELQRAAEAHA